MLDRNRLETYILDQFEHYPAVMMLGPRQCGKTTLARVICDKLNGTYFDLEDPQTPLRPDIAATVLKSHTGLVVIDEIQLQPELFSLLRVLADQKAAQYLILGSASPQLVKGASESLAGRVAHVDMAGFTLADVKDVNALWLNGSFPPSYMGNESMSYKWRQNYSRTFLERDIPALGIRVPLHTLRRFWAMLAHFHGQTWNASELAKAMGEKESMMRRYLDILTGALVIRQLPAFHLNTKKRLVKAPKLFFCDSGLLHVMLQIRTLSELYAHHRLGFSWEGFLIDQIIRITRSEQEAFYYKTHAGAELDLVIVKGQRRVGFEFKFSDQPKTTKSMHVAISDLALETLYVVYPGATDYPLGEKIEALSVASLLQVCLGLA